MEKNYLEIGLYSNMQKELKEEVVVYPMVVEVEMIEEAETVEAETVGEEESTKTQVASNVLETNTDHLLEPDTKSE